VAALALPWRMRFSFLAFSSLVFVGCGGMSIQRPLAAPTAGMLHRSGTHIVDDKGAPVELRGVSFGNEVWTNEPLPVKHHDESDYVRIAAMGMNAVRFYMNYRTFEDDSAPYHYQEEGFAWIDRNVAWAKRNSVRLILNIHVPQGGFQSNGAGGKLWTDSENQARFVALWRAIAERYRQEPVIAGYDFLNEPRPTVNRKQWHELAQRTAAAVREIDREHILFIERVNSVGEDWGNDADRNFFLIQDENTVYEFHFYGPFEYTHQYTSWTGLGEGGKYPDDTIISGIDEVWINVATFDSPALPVGTTDWAFFEGPRLRVVNPAIVVGKPALVGRSLGSKGRAIFDDLVVKEYNEKNEYVRDVASIDPQSIAGFYFWTKDGSGRASVVAKGHGSTPALAIEGTTNDANLGGFVHFFIPKPEYSYSLSGWMRGEDIPPGANAQIRLDFVGSKQPPQTRTKTYLERELSLYFAWGDQHGVPLFLGEFGLHHPCFENDRGGLVWVRDVLDILLARRVAFTYHAYHEDSFGIYPGSGALPDPSRVNQPLVDLFREKLQR